MYEVTRLFIGGVLSGMSFTEKTNVQYVVGFVCKNPIGGSPYRIVEVKIVNPIYLGQIQ